MSIFTHTYTITETGGNVEDTALVYEMPVGYGGVMELQVINLPKQSFCYITLWTTKVDSSEYNMEVIIWENYALFDAVAVIYDRFVLGSGEKVYCKVSKGKPNDKIVIQLRGFKERGA